MVHSYPGLGCPHVDSGFWERLPFLGKEAGPFSPRAKRVGIWLHLQRGAQQK